MLPLFLVSLLKTPYPIPLPLLTNPPTPTSWSWHSPTLGYRAFTGLRTSLPIDDQQGHPLLHIQLEPWVLPCVPFGWWFSPWELWEYWLVHIIVPPMGLQMPSAPLVLFLAPNWGPCAQSSGWLWAFTSLSGTSRSSQETTISGSCQQALVGIHNSVWVCCLYMGWIPSGTVSGWPFLQFLFYALSQYLLPWVFWSPSKRSIHTLVFLVLELHVICGLYLGYSEFWANIHLSVSAYCHGPPQLCMGVPGMWVLKVTWVRIRWWQTETNTEAVWIWAYFAAL